MSRQRLPETRASVTRKVEHTSNMDIYVIVGFFEPSTKGNPNFDGVEQPGEVFIMLGKEGSTLGGLCDMIGVTMSLSLQYGVPWEKISRKMRNTNFEPTNSEGKSIMHSVVTAVDKILSDRGSIPDRGYGL